MALAGLCSGMVMPSRDMIVREVTPPGSFGKVFAFVTTGYHIAGIVAPLVFGALLDHGEPRAIFYGGRGVHPALDLRRGERAAPPRRLSAWPPVRALLLLWLAGIALRLTILAVPPVIPLIHDDLHLSETQVGILSGLPMVLFAAAAIAGSLMIARLGALTALLIGLVLCAVGSALRGIGPHIAMLYFGTIVTAFGVAVMQPALPPLVRTWVPQRIGFATAVYTNGLLIGEILPAGADHPAGAADAAAELAMGFRVLGGAGRGHRRDHLRPRAARAGRRADRRQPALDAGLPQSDDLADRPAARQRQRHLFLDERLPARLSHPHRAARADQRRADRAQPRPASGVVPAARLGGPDGAHACGPIWPAG